MIASCRHSRARLMPQSHTSVPAALRCTQLPCLLDVLHCLRFAAGPGGELLWIKAIVRPIVLHSRWMGNSTCTRGMAQDWNSSGSKPTYAPSCCRMEGREAQRMETM